MSDDPLARARWYTSSHSNNQGGQCVAAARLPAAMALRDTKDPRGSVVIVGDGAWTRFLTSLNAP
ncbi:DUF397 domain-containing protein [Streptomyces sp. NPDC057638]|uniref:DUF397 domain-containing protein n=1 Tax=Streptomyces sp. NPDC057638 TaxID=3346190 RepID=UPI0036A26BDC